MSHLNPGLLAAYNSLTDKHLAGYFNNVRIRRHLQRVGLITRSGRIVPDKEYKHKLIQRAHQRHVRECLAQAIFHKVLDMERFHQSEIKRKLEEFAQRERIHKMKSERSRRYDEEPMLMLSPRPPTRPKISHPQHSGPEGENSTESTESPNSSRPNTAPGKMQRPVRLKPLNSNSTTASLRKSSPRYKVLDRDSSNDTVQPLSYMLERGTMRHTTVTDFSSTVSPYRLPVINNYVTPVPPLTKKKDKGTRANGTHRGRKLRPTTAPTEPPSVLLRTSAQSKVSVRMVYFGKSVHLSHDLMDLTDEVKVFQQHCGGENLCVFKGKLKEGEMFQFLSKRHQGFPFSLTFFLNGLQVERLSSCCEFKHRKGARLGGRHGHFGFCSVEGASPCYKCIIAMGLDKKPTPPVKRVKEEPSTSKSPDTKETPDAEEDTETHSNTDLHVSQEMETDRNGGTAEQKKPNDYEEDFEADDEGPLEDGDEVEEKPSSIASDGVKETETTDDKNEQKRDSDSEVEDASISKVKRSPSVSSGRTSSLSSRDSDNYEKEIEDDNKEIITADVVEESLHVEPEEDLTPAHMKEKSSCVALPQAAEDSETQDSPEDGMEKSELEMSEDTEKNENTVGEEAGEEAKPDGEPQETESERATSIQEKLAEAILKESQCSSEPELSDTSTEEDEGASVKTQQDSHGAETESAVGFTSPQPPNTQQDIPEENEDNTQEAVFDEMSQCDDETGQPAEETDTQMPYTHKQEEEQSVRNEKLTASLDEKQELEEREETNEVKQQQDEKEEVQTETKADIKDGGQKEEVKNEAVEVNTESKEEEPETQDVTAMVSELVEESALEKEGSISHTENDTETGVADTERKADDADQSNGQPDRDERDDLTDDGRSTGEKVQDTDGVMDEYGEKSSEDRGDSADEEVKEEVEKEEQHNVVLEEVEEKLDDENERKDVEIEEGEIHAAEKENEVEEDSKAEDKENEESTEREEDGVIERQDVLQDKEESGEAEHKENEGGQDLNVEDTERENDVEREEDDGQRGTEDGEQVIDKLLEEEKQNQKCENEIVEETEKVNNEMMENREKEEEHENEVEESKRDKMEEREGESVENEAKDKEHENKLTEDFKCNEDETEKVVEEVEEINEISENVKEEKDGNKEDDILGENEAQKSEDNFTEDQNEESVLHEEQMEISSSSALKDDTEPSIKEEVDEPPDGVNDDLASNIDAENGEIQNARPDDVKNVENHLQDEETQDRMDDVTFGKIQDVTDDSETKPEIEEDKREDKDVQEGQDRDIQKAVDDKSMTEEADKESETSAKTFIENVIPEKMLDMQETANNNAVGEDTNKEPNVMDLRMDDVTFGKTQDVTDDSETKPEIEEDKKEDKDVQEGQDRDIQKAVDDKSMTEEADKESETSAKTFIENVVPEKMLDMQETANNNAEGEDMNKEPNVIEKEPKVTDNDLESRAAPEENDGEPEEPLEKIENPVNEEQGGSSMSHLVESQPVDKDLGFKKLEKDLSIDSEDPVIRTSVLGKADGVDLVSNWINIHQNSRYFQTYIEPLDEIKESSISDETEKELNGEVFDAESADLGGLDETIKSRDESATSVKSDHNENTEHDTKVENFITETKPDVVEDVHSVQSKDDIHSITKYEVKEGGDKRGSLVTSWSRQESNNDDNTNQNETVRHEDPTEDKVINLSTTEDTSENIQGRNSSETGEQDLVINSHLNPSCQEESEENEQQKTMIEDMTQLSSASQTEETTDKEILDSSEPNLKSEHVAQSDYIEPQSPTITVITDLTIINKSESGSQDDTASVDVHSRHSDGNRKTKVIDGHLSVGRDTLSTFSLDDSRFFGPAGYPRLTTAHTENSY